MILGDSLSSGHGFDPKKAWPALLARQLEESGYPHQVINASVSGDTTLAGLSRLDTIRQRWQPDIVVVQLGGNDGLRGLPTNLIKSNLAKILEKLKAHQITTLLVGIQLPPNYGQKYNIRFKNIYSELATEYDVKYVPFSFTGGCPAGGSDAGRWHSPASGGTIRVDAECLADT